ncbi:glycosyltransferase family 25 protein [Aquabacterium sp. A7-Y]|nr:glycosyltransferase family 25 protein [Aquabacterium sp. A7-Y]
MGNTNIRTLVISLAESAERRSLMSERLTKAGLEAEFFDAVNGRTLRRNSRSLWAKAAQLSDGELGCYLSHVGVWRKIADENIPFALVLEDDVDLHGDLASVCTELAALPLSFDLVRLSSLEPQIGKPIRQLANDRTLILPTKDPFGTQGYLLSLAGARRLLSVISEPCLPIDREFNLYWRHGLQSLLISPPVVQHDWELESTIVPTGRAEIVTSLPPLARVIRSLQKRRAIYRIFKSVAHKGLFSFISTSYAHE